MIVSEDQIRRVSSSRPSGPGAQPAACPNSRQQACGSLGLVHARVVGGRKLGAALQAGGWEACGTQWYWCCLGKGRDRDGTQTTHCTAGRHGQGQLHGAAAWSAWAAAWGRAMNNGTTAARADLERQDGGGELRHRVGARWQRAQHLQAHGWAPAPVGRAAVQRRVHPCLACQPVASKSGHSGRREPAGNRQLFPQAAQRPC